MAAVWAVAVAAHLHVLDRIADGIERKVEVLVHVIDVVPCNVRGIHVCAMVSS